MHLKPIRSRIISSFYVGTKVVCLHGLIVRSRRSIWQIWIPQDFNVVQILDAQLLQRLIAEVAYVATFVENELLFDGYAKGLLYVFHEIEHDQVLIAFYHNLLLVGPICGHQLDYIATRSVILRGYLEICLANKRARFRVVMLW